MNEEAKTIFIIKHSNIYKSEDNELTKAIKKILTINKHRNARNKELRKKLEKKNNKIKELQERIADLESQIFEAEEYLNN